MLGTILLAALVQLPAQTQELAPGTRYDPSIPSLEQVVGHDFGEAITSPAQVVRYFEALEAAAPNRTRLMQYAESWEGRPLIVMVIGSAERMGRLDEVKAELDRFAAVESLSDADADALLQELPVRDCAHARCARQRDQLERRGDGRGVPPSGGPGRPDRRPDSF